MRDWVRLSRPLVLSSKSRRRLDANYEIFNKSRPPTTSSLQVQRRVKRLDTVRCSVQLVSQCFGDVVASCVVCLLNIPATDKMLQLRTRKNYWNIFVVSWRRRQPCLRQLRPRPIALKSRTRTRSRSRIWRSLFLQNLVLNDDGIRFFSRQNDASLRALNVFLRGNLVLVVVLVLTKSLYILCSMPYFRSGLGAHPVEQRWLKSEGRGFESHPDQGFPCVDLFPFLGLT